MDHPAPPSDIVAPLILDFLEWLARAPRPYDEAMAAWRTSCPRLTVWEDAFDHGLVMRAADGANRAGTVALTPLGMRRLKECGRLAP